MEDKITRKELYHELWKGRDLELTNLWQRSIFLMSFLVIAFTAYCGLWVQLFNKENPSIYQLMLINFGLIFISVFGIISSILWIMMSKGSKYWYEKYEGSISRIIEGEELNSDELTNSDRHSKLIEEGCKLKMNTIFSESPDYYPRHGYLSDIALNTKQVNNCLISTKAGAFSVSKVNIGIGIVTGWLWILLAAVHTILLCALWNSANGVNFVNSTYITLSNVSLIEVSLPVGITAVSLLIDVLPKWPLWVGVSIPGLFFVGFIVMCGCGLFSSSESKMLKRRDLKKKIRDYFSMKEKDKAKFDNHANTEKDLFKEFLVKASKEFSENDKRKNLKSELEYNFQWPLFANEGKYEKLVKISKTLKIDSFFKRLNYRELCYVDTMLNRVLYETERVKRELELIQ